VIAIPFLDLGASGAAAQPHVEQALLRVARSGHYLRGAEVDAFERAWAATCAASGAVATSSGTDALRLALSAAGVRAGDQVVVPAFGSPYTALAVCAAGATPAFADIDAATFTMTPATAAAALGPRTRALVAVHLFGRRADTRGLRALADAHGLLLIEDAAQAHGLAGPPAGHAAAFSFYPTKNLGALGDAGCLVSDDPSLLARARVLREGGQPDALTGDVACGVARMDELQAAVLLAKLPHLPAWTARRRAIAERYRRALGSCAALQLPADAPPADHASHLFVVEHADRDALAVRLARAGVETRVHYAHPLHRQPVFAVTAPSLPHAERAAARVLSLPLHPGLDDRAVDHVIDQLLRLA
jgi:dTDP-3-amino-3,4,6-trideoxy-alpha-D-glucose transaminase